MRDEVLREIVTRILTDQTFAHKLDEQPERVLRPYRLTKQEAAALCEQLKGMTLNPQAPISESLSRYLISQICSAI